MFLLHQGHATDLPVDETHERHNPLTPSLKSRARATSTYGTRHASTCTREFWIRFARAGLSLLRSISIRSDSGKKKKRGTERYTNYPSLPSLTFPPSFPFVFSLFLPFFFIFFFITTLSLLLCLCPS